MIWKSFHSDALSVTECFIASLMQMEVLSLFPSLSLLASVLSRIRAAKLGVILKHKAFYQPLFPFRRWFSLSLQTSIKLGVILKHDAPAFVHLLLSHIAFLLGAIAIYEGVKRKAAFERVGGRIVTKT